MKKLLFTLTIITLFQISCKTTTKNSSTTSLGKIHNVSISEFQKAMKLSDATLVDVRTPEEYTEYHIKGAININWYKRTFRNYVLNIPQDKPILIYCRTGNRTSKTSTALQSLGFENIYNLEKGIKQWKIENAPTTTEDTQRNKDFNKLASNTSNDVDAAIEKAASAGMGKIYNVNALDFQKAISLPNATLVDVRTPEEFTIEHIKGALNIDWYKRGFKDSIQTIAKDKPIIIYCRSGNRTSKAASAMQALGFKEIYNLNKGIKDWKKSKLPLE
jgi:rhodanese-related sulfurtransferase